ncbi:MAG: glutaminase [Desulfuromonadales bacterium]|nr:glutaminase [Desulfuromonadales bacterium]
MTLNCQEVLDEIHREIQPLIGRGTIPDYIPPLAKVSGKKFGMALQTTDGHSCEIGDAAERFSIQSISKLFSLTLAFRLVGTSLWKRVGREPSGTPFNSLVQLEYERGIPRNPFINAGALVITDIILEHVDDPQKTYLSFLQQITGIPSVKISKTVYQAEIKSGHRNRALANLLKDFGNLRHNVEDVLSFYFFQCAVMMNCTELAMASLFLANNGEAPVAGEVVSQRHAKRINAVMLTCGTYDAAGDFAYRVGLPGKSGVGGGIVAVVPGRMSLCVWSPALNSAGNSYAGTKALELFTTKTRLSVF